MGNDGGSIPKRQDLVKQKRRERKVESTFIDKARSSLCALSKEPLKKPIVICKLGNLYNKSNLIEALMEKKMPSCFAHIKGLKDFQEAKVCLKNPLGSHSGSTESTTIVCPITQIEYNGKARFVMMWRCGCVVSEKALVELKFNQSMKCIVCGAPCAKKDMISLNMTKEEQAKRKKVLLESSHSTIPKALATKHSLEESKFLIPHPKLCGPSSLEPEKKRKKFNESQANKSQSILENIKASIISTYNPQTLDKILHESKPDQKPPQDDFMTRCAHRGLH